MLAHSFLLLLSVAFSIYAKEIELTFDVPSPSGIMIDRLQNPQDGSIYRFGRLRYSMVGVRPEWAKINVVEDVLTPEECKMIIEKAENYSKVHGWSKGRHVDYSVRPTKDLPVKTTLFPTEEEFAWLDDRFKERIWPKFAMYYGLNQSLLSIDDLFLTKYSSDSNTASLASHQDKSPFSFVLTLNDNFENGGTFFTKFERVWKGPVGSAIIFHGYQSHGGEYPIDSVPFSLLISPHLDDVVQPIGSTRATATSWRASSTTGQTPTSSSSSSTILSTTDMRPRSDSGRAT
jgi:hypothetical protein